MKIRDKKKQKNTVCVAVIVLLIVLAITGGICLFLHFKSDDTNNPSTDVSSAVDSDPGLPDSDIIADQNDHTNDSSAESPEEDGNIQSPSDDGKTPIQYEGDNTNKSDSLTGVINYTSVSSDQLQVGTTINQFLENGTCKMTLTGPAKQVKTVTSDIAANPSSSSCGNLSIPLADLGNDRSGKWTINITLQSGDRTGQISGEVNL